MSTSEIGRVFRNEYGRAVAGLVRVFGDIDLAEDAVQVALALRLLGGLSTAQIAHAFLTPPRRPGPKALGPPAHCGGSGHRPEMS